MLKSLEHYHTLDTAQLIYKINIYYNTNSEPVLHFSQNSVCLSMADLSSLVGSGMLPTLKKRKIDY